jgi:hypothetical protein
MGASRSPHEEEAREWIAYQATWFVPLRDVQPKLADFRFVSAECEAKKPRDFRREHVIPRKVLEERIRNATTEAEVCDILHSAIVCAVTADEHSKLGPYNGGDGWQRYAAGGIQVIDRTSGKVP